MIKHNHLHSKNKHQGRYDLRALSAKNLELKEFIFQNQFGNETIDFSNPEAVKCLNKSLLLHQYPLNFWDLPEDALCPPIPGRADYIHHLSDLLNENKCSNQFPVDSVKVLDIGVGANCIYPIIGHFEYGWSFVGADTEKSSLENAQTIIDKNAGLNKTIELRFQENKKRIFEGIVREEEKFHLTMCNPPFHASEEEANEGTNRKLANLGIDSSIGRNFAGKSNELWYPGGEKRFVNEIIFQSKKFGENCMWFTSLVSKSKNLKDLRKTLEKLEAKKIIEIPMGQGNKVSRILAWTFQKNEQFIPQRFDADRKEED
ncbi:MAG: 23S rRNA (adenine(1618)-N(6))-methyltransferase RlmF [Bacteroidetes bacterium]|nr:23S rRNA (adenine(1618)-N(6))-methyltransferase RlmF [Bacteroidota bacterium]